MCDKYIYEVIIERNCSYYGKGWIQSVRLMNTVFVYANHIELLISTTFKV